MRNSSEKLLVRLFSIISIVALLLSMGLPTFAVEDDQRLDLSGETEEFNASGHKVAHVGDMNKLTGYQFGEIELDGRGQNYAWSAIGYGDYVYFGTAFNPIAFFGYSSLTQILMYGLGLDAADAQNITDKVMTLIFDNHFYNKVKPQDLYPVIVKFHKETGEATIVRSENTLGYRNAAEFNDKLYFVTAGSPGTLIEVDPETDESRVVYTPEDFNTDTERPISGGIRALGSYKDYLVLSYTDADGVHIVASQNPGENGDLAVTSEGSFGNWIEIADHDTFDGLPSFYLDDAETGGGVWDFAEFNGALYVSIVPSMTYDDETGRTKKRGHMLYKVTESSGEWNWEAIIGDTNNGAQYPFGLGVNESAGSTLLVYKNSLYIGGFNDMMTSIPAMATGYFEFAYNDLKNPVNLYRMDANENIEMIIGDHDELFPDGGIGNMGSGFDNPQNQYVWRLAEYDGKLFVGTLDVSTLSSWFTQLTNGEFDDYTEEDYMRRLDQVIALIESILTASEGEWGGPVIDIQASSDSLSLEEQSKQEISETNEVDTGSAEGELNEQENDEETSDEQNTPTETEQEVATENESELDKNQSEPINKEELENIQSELIQLMAILQGDSTMKAQTFSIAGFDDFDDFDEQDAVEQFEALVEYYNEIRDELPEEVRYMLDEILNSEAAKQIVYYFAVSDFAKQATKGFDLLMSEDGINFIEITRDGFGMENNYGVRSTVSTDLGLFFGTANPFSGTQIWQIQAPMKQTPKLELESYEDTLTTATDVIATFNLAEAPIVLFSADSDSDTEYKVYASETGDELSSAVATVDDDQLILTLDKPISTITEYFVTAKDKGMLESERVKVTVYPYVKSGISSLADLAYSVQGGEFVGVPNFAPDVYTYNVTLSSETAKDAFISLAGTPIDSKAKITKNDGVTLKDGKGTATIEVTAEDGSTSTYSVSFTVEVANSDDTPIDGKDEDKGDNKLPNTGGAVNHIVYSLIAGLLFVTTGTVFFIRRRFFMS